MIKAPEPVLCCAFEDVQYVFERTIYKLKIVVSSNDSRFIRWLNFHLSGIDRFRPHSDQHTVTAQYHVHMSDETLAAEGVHRLFGPDDLAVKSRSWGHIQAHLERAITRAARRYLAPYHVVHAGAVARAGRALLFPAFPGSGKSTLVAALALSGFEYYTDEVAVFTEEGRLLPYPKAITLKRGGWDAVSELFPLAESAAYAPVHHEKLHYLAAPNVPASSAMETGCDVEFVVFPRYAPDETTSLRPIARPAALARLAERSLNLVLLGQEGFDVIYNVILGTRCYELVTNDLTKAVLLMEALCDGHPHEE